jgi:hypothetical protein
MYKRDVQAESKESLVALLQGIDHLTEVVSKDSTLAEVRDLLKSSGVKDVKEIPKSDAKVDDLIRMPRVRAGVGTDGAATFGGFGGVMGYARFNNMMRALTGDLGAFQRVIFNTVGIAQRAGVLAGKAGSAATATLETPKVKTTYRPATDDEIAEAMKTAAAKGLSGAAMLQVAADLAKKGVPVQGTAAQNAQNIVQNAQQAKGVTGTAVVQRGTATSGSAVATLDTAAMVKIGTTVALAAAPVVATKLLTSMTQGQIESKRGFGMLDPTLAGAYTQYGFERLLLNMRHARGIAPGMEALIKGTTQLEKNLEPFQTFGTNVKSRFLEIGANVANTLIGGAANWMRQLNEQGGTLKQALEEAGAWAGWGAIAGGTIGAIAGGILGIPGGPVGIIGGAIKGASVGAGIGGINAGVAGGVYGLLKPSDVDKLKEKFSKGGPLDAFASGLSDLNFVPARRFVP